MVPADASKAVTLYLEAAAGGDREAATQLLPLVYGELRKLAKARMAMLNQGQTLQPTALVHGRVLLQPDSGGAAHA